MKARVIQSCSVHNIPREVGALVDVDDNTFRNLVLKGRLAAAIEQPYAESDYAAMVARDRKADDREPEPPKRRGRPPKHD